MPLSPVLNPAPIKATPINGLKTPKAIVATARSKARFKIRSNRVTTTPYLQAAHFRFVWLVLSKFQFSSEFIVCRINGSIRDRESASSSLRPLPTLLEEIEIGRAHV